MTEGAVASPVEAQGDKKNGGFIRTTGKVVLWIVLGIAGFLLNEGLTWAKNKQLGGDDQLVKLAQDQKAEFKLLHEGLRELGSAIPSSDRAGLKEVKGAIANIESQNRDLIRMITLAREENDRTRQLAKANSDINGGYDFVLTENSGLQLDAQNSLGVSNISRDAVVLNMSQVGASEPTRSYLRSGQSAAYVNAGGRSCRIALLSISGSGDAATFSNLCGAGPQAG